MKPGSRMYEDDLELQKELEAAARDAEAVALGSQGTNLPNVTRVEVEPEAVTPPSREVIAPKVVQVPGGMEDMDMAYAAAQDRAAKRRMAFERGSRELVAGLTRTQVPDIISQPGDSVGKLLTARKAREEREAKAAALAMQGKKAQAEAERALALDARHAKERGEDLEQRELSNELRGDATEAQRGQSQAMLALARGAAGRAEAEEERKAKAEVPKAAAELRKEFNALPDVKTFGEVDAAFQKVQAAAGDPSAAGDLSAIFAYMKMLDPGSSVREGEFANAQNAGGIDAKISAAYNNVLNGQRLTPEQRADFINQAKKLFQVHKTRRDTQATRYSELAKKQGLAPEDVTGNTAGVTVRRKKDGATKTVSPDVAEKILQSSDYERVTDG